VSGPAEEVGYPGRLQESEVVGRHLLGDQEDDVIDIDIAALEGKGPLASAPMANRFALESAIWSVRSILRQLRHIANNGVWLGQVRADQVLWRSDGPEFR
jgi:hypothetical protein